MNRTRGAPTDFAYTPASKKRPSTTTTTLPGNQDGGENGTDDMTDKSNTMDDSMIIFRLFSLNEINLYLKYQ